MPGVLTAKEANLFGRRASRFFFDRGVFGGLRGVKIPKVWAKEGCGLVLKVMPPWSDTTNCKSVEDLCRIYRMNVGCCSEGRHG